MTGQQKNGGRKAFFWIYQKQKAGKVALTSSGGDSASGDLLSD
ncbi:MAG: hypothetical protein V8S96_02690 [Lachnospiraceae bacterium]